MNNAKDKDKNALAKISADRSRTNISKKYEQQMLAYLVQRMPSWMTSDMLTGIGFIGSIIIFAAFVLAAYINKYFLLVGIIGFAINWFGDSLDGRLAYYRNKPRKWYGFSLDFTVDWLTNILIGLGFVIYVNNSWAMVGFGFVMLYGWSMIMALLRYKIINQYTIDTNFLGPTEVRFIISFILIFEVIFQGSIIYFGAGICLILLIINIIDFFKLLKLADQRDKEERSSH